MNERIWEIYGEALLGTADNGGDVLDPMKFAELIVKECMSYMKDGDVDFAKFMIKRNFGVDE